MEPKDMTNELSKQSDLSLMMRLRDLDIPRGAYWENTIIIELLRRLNEADTLRKENDIMSQLLYRLCSLNNTDPFDGARAMLDARELLHSREERLAKESEASHAD